MRQLDEEGSVSLTKSRINHALPACLVIHGTKLIKHPPPMSDLTVVHGSRNVEIGNENGPIGAKNKEQYHIVREYDRMEGVSA
jgi:hypothetical protein